MGEHLNLERIYAGANSTVYRTQGADGRSLIIKQLAGTHPTAEAIARLRREYQIVCQAAGDAVVSTVRMDEIEGRPAILFEDTGARSLAEALRRSPLTLIEALRVGERLAGVIGHIHAANIIHKDINPSNVVWDRETEVLELIDFGIASRLSRETPALASPARLEGTLAYIAPEQTGRMNRRVDYRADLYSLGATLYEMLCGRPPFVGDDPLYLVHAHIALEAPPAHTINPAVPEVVSAIVARLLAKSAEDRYQSAAGLRANLRRCVEALERSGRVEPFELGGDDTSYRLRVPDTLYGRAAERALLFSAWGDALDGQFELILVAGRAGIGKTALVNEIQRPLAETRGYFLSGKCEAYNRGTPYGVLLQAFGVLIANLLTEPEEVIATWKGRILAGLAGDGRVLSEVLPELSLILGEQPPVPALPPAETANRFQIVFLRFIRSLCGREHPLVLFLDDLQWADTPTLTLLTGLAADPDAGHLLTIGAYRDNEVNPLHPLSIALDRIARAGKVVHKLTLRPLSLEDVRGLIADTLRLDVEAVGPLAELCFRKTRGNPFYLNQFIEALYHDDMLRADPEQGWRWDLADIERREATENVVDFMSSRLLRMPGDALAVISRAAFIGTAFDTGTLATLTGRDAAEVRALLTDALSEDLILATDDVAGQLRFAHDRVQQVAYTLIPEAERPAIHLAVGRMALARYRGSAARRGVFDVVNHLNAGESVMTDPSERDAACTLNLEAGASALLAAAYEPADSYLSMAIALLPADPWQGDYARTLRAHLDAARSAYLNLNEERMQALIEAVLLNARSEQDKVAAYKVSLSASYAGGDFDGTLDKGLALLRLLGIDLPDQPGEAEVIAGLTKTQAAMAGLDEAAILALPKTANTRAAAAAAILEKLASPAYFARPMLLPLVAFELVQSALRDGLAGESQFGFVIRGLFLCMIGDIAGGIASGRIAIALAADSDARAVAAVTRHIHTAHIRFWYERWSDLREPAREIAGEAYDLGDFLYSSFAASISGVYALFGGDELRALLPDTQAYLDRLLALDQDIPIRMQRINVQLIHNLVHGPEVPGELTGEVWVASEGVPELERAGDATSLYMFYTLKLLQLFVLGDYAAAAEAAEANQAWLAGAASSIYVPNYTYFDALTQLQVLDDLDGARREGAIARVDAALGQLEGWATFGDMHHHRIALLKAERARVLGGEGSLYALYTEAAALAGADTPLCDQALVNELAGRFYLSVGNRTVARGYLSEARHLYERWGAGAKLTQMEEVYGAHLQMSRAAGGTNTSGTGDGIELDALAVIRTSRAISREIKLTRLVERLLATSIESTGARKGVLLLVEKGELIVEAEGAADVEVTAAAIHRPAAGYEGCSGAVLRYVQRVRKPVILSDACEEGLFTDDPYIKSRAVRSVLCLPLEQQGQLIAILYLENDQTADTFNDGRVEPLQLILAQAAISIENARLVTNLEEKVKERTRELVTARERSDQLLLNILPEAIADELKERGHTEPVSFESASVLFTDFKGFTNISERLSPKQLVAELDRSFSAFDDIAAAHGLETLKTIGDSYMCVGGIPAPNRTHAVDCILAGLALQAYMERLKGQRAARGEECWELRLGIHTGPLVAGVIGTRKFAYDVWGDTVNTASRMESSGAPSKVNVSAATWRWAEPLFVGTYRGEVKAKNKGAIPMYFIERIKPEYSADALGLTPNDAFHIARERVEASVQRPQG